LLLHDALLKCVVTEVVLFSIVAFNTQGSVATHVRCGGIFSDSIIRKILLILTVKSVWKLMKLRRTGKNVQFLGHPICWCCIGLMYAMT